METVGADVRVVLQRVTSLPEEMVFSADSRSCSEVIRDKLSGADCVLAYETASDYLGTNCLTDGRPAMYVYSLSELNIDGVECTVVDSFDGMEIETDGVLRYTSARQTVLDLLAGDRCPQVTVEALSDWYETHSLSFDGLDIPDSLVSIFEEYKEDAIHYYDY